MAAIKQHGCSAVRCRKLKPPSSGHVRGFDFGDHAGKRAIAQAVFRHCQYLRVLAALRVQDAVGAKPDLLKPGRVKVELRENPEHCPAVAAGEPGSYARCE